MRGQAASIAAVVLAVAKHNGIHRSCRELHLIASHEHCLLQIYPGRKMPFQCTAMTAQWKKWHNSHPNTVLGMVLRESYANIYTLP